MSRELIGAAKLFLSQLQLQLQLQLQSIGVILSQTGHVVGGAVFVVVSGSGCWVVVLGSGS